jgi:DNA-binding HxlR family transcriptional regulator
MKQVMMKAATAVRPLEPVLESPDTGQVCQHDHRLALLAMRDAMNILGGKWRIPLIGALCLRGKMRFSELVRELDGIGAKMLSKELQELELNKLITRTAKNTKPITVEYEMTEYGLSLKKLVGEIINWGIGYREHIMGSPLTPIRDEAQQSNESPKSQSRRVC